MVLNPYERFCLSARKSKTKEFEKVNFGIVAEVKPFQLSSYISSDQIPNIQILDRASLVKRKLL
jgi:hypothetical protein